MSRFRSSINFKVGAYCAAENGCTTKKRKACVSVDSAGETDAPQTAFTSVHVLGLSDVHDWCANSPYTQCTASETLSNSTFTFLEDKSVTECVDSDLSVATSNSLDDEEFSIQIQPNEEEEDQDSADDLGVEVEDENFIVRLAENAGSRLGNSFNGSLGRERYCKNCHRAEVADAGVAMQYHVGLQEVDTSTIRFKLKNWLTFGPSDCDDTSGSVLLCEECASYLVKSDDQRPAKWKEAWPSYMWQFLCDTSLTAKHGDHLLAFIPWEWRIFWISELTKVVPDIYDPAKIGWYLNDMEKVVTDVTNQCKEM
jgi:hypothetical protein